MAERDEKLWSAEPLTGLQAALADVAERRRKDPNWRSVLDPTYSGPDPRRLEGMTEADYAAYEAEREARRRWLRGDPRPVEPQAVRQEEPPLRARTANRACLPFGQRIRDLRRALRWTQREIAWHLGVSSRSIIRYEQGQSAPVQVAPLFALRRLESTFAHELHTVKPLIEANP